MNVFEDLIVELKKENLLETSDITDSQETLGDPEELWDDSVLTSPDLERPDDLRLNAEHDDSSPSQEHGSDDDPDAEYNYAEPLVSSDTVESADLQFLGSDETIEIRKPNSAREFFKKRAVNEMSSLRMVDAVISSIEREHLRILPATFDDLEAQKALHAFLRIADDEIGDEHKQAEFDLLQETEKWCSALAVRDRAIPVAYLREYCENCRPMLSSQAMLSLARFYRNLPYSEAVRGKFDFVITRLFSKPLDFDKRVLLFPRESVLGHVKTLYADWSSIPLYSTDEDDSDIRLTAMSFFELANEAESASVFDDLIKSDFFARLRLFKESIAEMYFAPAVTAAAIECNIRIGNVYVHLITRERLKMDVDSIHAKYAELDDQTVSEAAGRSLGLMDLLRIPVEDIVEQQFEEPVVDEVSPITQFNYEPVETEAVAVEQKAPVPSEIWSRVKEQIRSVNKFLLLGSAMLIVLSVGLYIWANYYAGPAVTNVGVKTLSFKDTEFADQIKLAKLSIDTLYVVVQPTFAGLPKERQSEVLQKIYQSGNERSWVKVILLSPEGKTIGFASATRSEIYTSNQ